MRRTEIIYTKILDAATNSLFINTYDFEMRSKYKKSDFSIMIKKKKNGTVKIANCTRTGDLKLFVMVTQSLALLTIFLNGKDKELENFIKCKKSELETLLDKIWGSPVTIGNDKYDKIMNQ
jgi:hypothetical protein